MLTTFTALIRTNRISPKNVIHCILGFSQVQSLNTRIVNINPTRTLLRHTNPPIKCCLRMAGEHINNDQPQTRQCNKRSRVPSTRQTTTHAHKQEFQILQQLFATIGLHKLQHLAYDSVRKALGTQLACINVQRLVLFKTHGHTIPQRNIVHGQIVPRNQPTSNPPRPSP